MGKTIHGEKIPGKDGPLFYPPPKKRATLSISDKIEIRSKTMKQKHFKKWNS